MIELRVGPLLRESITAIRLEHGYGACVSVEQDVQAREHVLLHRQPVVGERDSGQRKPTGKAQLGQLLRAGLDETHVADTRRLGAARRFRQELGLRIHQHNLTHERRQRERSRPYAATEVQHTIVY